MNDAKKLEGKARDTGVHLSFLVAVLLLVGCVGAPGLEAARRPPSQTTFGTPEAAIRALVQAVQRQDARTVRAVLGPESRDIVSSGDPVEDRNHRTDFLRKVREKCQIVSLKGNGLGLRIGKDHWLFPIPLVQQGSRWRFDSAAGRQEVLARRIGQHELALIDFCHLYVDAQREYFARDRTGQGRQYAQKFRSSAGKKDGLYWPAAKGQPQSPLGPLVARATHEGYRAQEKPIPFYGYYFRILTGQGSHAAGGEKTYLVNGKMTAGFALVAWPAKYRNSGVMTFLVDQSGIVYEKDLGAQTDALARSMKVCDPDETWKPARKPQDQGMTGNRT